MAWIVFVPGLYTLIQSVWVESKVLRRAAAKLEFSGIFLMRQEWKTVQHSRSSHLPLSPHSLFKVLSFYWSRQHLERLALFGSLGFIVLDCVIGGTWPQMCRAEGTDSESHKLQESRHCVAGHRPRAERDGGFPSPLYECRWLKVFFYSIRPG